MMKLSVKHQRGFTLVELLAVMVLMSILLGITITSFKGVKASALELASSDVASMVKLTRSKAVEYNSDAYLVFTHDSNNANMYGNLEEKKRFLRAYAIYVKKEGFVSEWRYLPEGIIFHPSLTSSYANNEKNIFDTGNNFTEEIEYPEPGDTAVTFVAFNFRSDGSMPYSNSSMPAIPIVEGATNAETDPAASSLDAWVTGKAAGINVVVRWGNGQLVFREESNIADI